MSLIVSFLPCSARQYALDRLPKHRAEELYRRYTSFEKQFGDKDGVEGIILAKRRAQVGWRVDVAVRL